MSNYNSDGYILLDMSNVDVTKSSQYVAGMYDRIVNGINNTNKLVIVINVSNYLPMAATIRKVSNYYEVITELYIFKINTNDIVITQENAGSFSEVTIVPTLLEGVKLAEFTIGGVSGAIFAPPQESEINDSVASDHTTFSSDKINNLINGVTISNLNDIGDVDINTPTNSQVLSYDSTSNKWINSNAPQTGTEVKHTTITLSTASNGFATYEFDSDLLILAAWSDVSDNVIIAYPQIVGSLTYKTWCFLSKNSPAISTGKQLSNATVHILYIDKNFT